MKLVAYQVASGRTRLGVLDTQQERVFDIDIAPHADAAAALRHHIGHFDPARLEEARQREGVPLADVTLQAPLPQQIRNIFCVGKNYYDHSTEFATSGFDASSNADIPSKPIFFTKPPTSVIGPDAEIDPHPDVTDSIDYEVELVVIIGTEGRAIPAARAWEHVWGYTILNDVTARDLQRDHNQWFLGKSLDTFCPVGPWAVSADEVDPLDMTVETLVNGELRQQANTKDLIFDIPTLITTLSAGITLYPGDLIATGTPSGVGLGFTPPKFLKPGDEVEVRVSGLGTLRNRLVRAPAPAVP